MKMLLALITVLYTVKIFKLSAVSDDVITAKHVLMWTPRDWYPFSMWKTGSESFIENRCRFSNCYISARNEMSVELSRFDAIAFNGRNFDRNGFRLPTRYNHQKYIFFNTESADNYPICHPIYDSFFNLTASYKLNSDIDYSYIVIKNSSGHVIGPKMDMNWPNNINSSLEETKIVNLNKTKAVVWFASYCATRSKRETYAKNLKNALKKHNLELDVYGDCGKLKCSKKDTSCDEILRKYYFYLAFENSFAEDYITEKLLRPIQNYNVPIVYGGANYSRFLPPGTYLDARSHSPAQLAGIIARVIGNPVEYKQFFKLSQYTYETPMHVCRLCEALNNEDLMKTRKVYDDLRRWWNPDYEKRCKN